MQKTELVYGLPWLQTKPERAIFDELQFACVYAAGPLGGRPLRLGASTNLKKRIECLQPGSWEPLKIHHAIWTTNEAFAVRIFNDSAALFDKAKRRLVGDWFDVTPEFAVQAIRLAGEKANVPMLSHDGLLEKVRAIREKRLNSGIVVRKR
ncbi:hypothetical protein [Bradyrhizobium diazoefficiens]|uniref:GIY-YIG nuclease family protein n=1 Tax=Bradyrhizobium diazoefficiens TaxID=1355477 RepID=A0A809X554_9BRAD|nr:hypothetical protein XF1B_47960 [Bradyrhizobium diazoefficiens]BCE48380.1 hypothetical protein XF4B_47290 [Bradyrhizobium diazoefficiens]BCE91896.1 hypothetical protein XF10B_46940 [Bradyrhizobium diazoefficiens]BCF26824.1 hypothetical protein XF14B_47760 [Bradyrhizobium diazoefficiens]